MCVYNEGYNTAQQRHMLGWNGKLIQWTLTELEFSNIIIHVGSFWE